MFEPLAGAASETIYTAKNISTLLLGRLTFRFVGLSFLIAGAVITTQVTTGSQNIGKAFNSLPHVLSFVSPVITGAKGPDLGEINKLKFTDEVKTESGLFSTPQTTGNFLASAQSINTPQGKLLYNKKLRVFATSYDPYCPGCSNTTAIGMKAGYGVIAVDPTVIPLGSKVYVPGYGKAVAGDTGSAIKGAVVDLGFDNVKKGWWSARFTDLYILAD